MSQAMMFKGSPELRTILLALDPLQTVQDEDRLPETGATLLARLDSDDDASAQAIPSLLLSGINRDGYLVFLKNRKSKTGDRVVWLTLEVPPPDRFQLVPYDAAQVAERLSDYVDIPPSS